MNNEARIWHGGTCIPVHALVHAGHGRVEVWRSDCGVGEMKLGSLFDGSGTAPLAAAMCGIEPVWASEIEPYPVKVTTARFPGMKHLGDITLINGAGIEPVDAVCGGSPCQDLSKAGKQKGLHDGERSHLFFEMIRIIKEMREATNGKYPRYIIWENVPGAFSSNKGHDFLAVLQAFAEIADPDIHVPEPERKSDRLVWKYAGEVVGDGWSIAWRTMDAQYWGVPQRRRRIYLVADLGSECAGEILFKRESDSGLSFETKESIKEATACCGGGTAIDTHSEIAAVYATDVGLWTSAYEVSPTLLARTYKDPHLMVIVYKNGDIECRRLTPLECCRLQGFPDWWEDGVEGRDSERYKMWGNGMALPNMLHVMKGIAMGRGSEGGMR